MEAIAVHGMGATYMEPLGDSIGWALLQIFMIMIAIVSGLIPGEWIGFRKEFEILCRIASSGAGHRLHCILKFTDL